MRPNLAALVTQRPSIGVGRLVSPASAASYPSTAAYYGPVAGYSYYNKSTLVISGSGNWAEASVTRTGSTPPAGWMGAQVTLYKNGAQCSAGNMLYTTSTAGVDRVRGRVAAGQGGRRVIIGGCEDNEELVADRCP